jgi:hypothetical protein
MAWITDQTIYVQEYQALARPVWADPAGQRHSLFE